MRTHATPLAAGQVALTDVERGRFHALFRDHFDFVFRSLRRLGVAAEDVDDALQEVYVVALRRIADYRDDTHPKAWLFAIARRVASNRRRTVRRGGTRTSLSEDGFAAAGEGAFESVLRAQAGDLLHAFLDTLDDDKRAVFVMTELEQMTAPEIAQAVSANVSTVYTRLRAARAQFANMIAKLARRDGERHG